MGTKDFKVVILELEISHTSFYVKMYVLSNLGTK